MKKQLLSLGFLLLSVAGFAQGPRVTVAEGTLEGIDSSGVKIFKGVPFAQPPVGNLRWKAPQPKEHWTGVRAAKEFGANPIQYNAFGDMIFGTNKFSEDCLYLNVWTPAKKMNEKLSVLIYFNGGGLTSGSGSEPRYQGLALARKGIIVVTANYREGIFGFLAHPQLSKENSYKGSGNWGFMDQAAAIKWVKDNIAAFGGDPNRITINGESAGSMSACALMASPMSKGLINQVMGSSGSVVAGATPKTLKQAEAEGVAWVKSTGYKKISDLRNLSTEQIVKLTKLNGVPAYCIDGKFLTEDPNETYRRGAQAQVPALIGNNSAELPVVVFMGGKAPTLENLKPVVEDFFGVEAQKVFDIYGIHNDADLLKYPGYKLGGDIFIAYNTWKWTDMLRESSRQPVYRYVFCHPRPDMTLKDKNPGLAGGTVDKKADEAPMPKNPGAVHSADIEYAMGNLSTNKMFAWDDTDYRTSQIFQDFYVNFVKTGNPNGLGLPEWTAYNNGDNIPNVMYIDTKSEQQQDEVTINRYRTMDKWLQAKSAAAKK